MMRVRRRMFMRARYVVRSIVILNPRWAHAEQIAVKRACLEAIKRAEREMRAVASQARAEKGRGK